VVALLLTPLARWIFGALAVLAVLGGIYAKGRHDGRAACESRVAAAVAAEQLRQNAVRAKALDNAVTRELAARADANEAEQKVAAYEATLVNPQPAVADANGNCPPRFILGADDVRALGVLQR